MDFQDKEILIKYLEGAISNEEKTKVEQLLSAKEEPDGLKSFFKQDWDDYLNSNEMPSKDMRHVLDRVHHAISINKYHASKKIRQKVIRVYSSIAAILLLPVLTISILLMLGMNNTLNFLSETPAIVRIESPDGAKLAFQLPDGTKGMLNSGSSIEYSLPFKKHRDINLSGEAYFDVTHDESNPFRVSTNTVNIEVMGTKFNVYAYPNEKYSEVLLEQGKVVCSLLSANNKIILKPNERIVVIDGKAVKSTVIASNYTAWKEGKLIFRGDPMEEVARRLSRSYNVDVIVGDEALSSYTFRATFENDSLEEVLDLLKMTSPIRCKITPREKQQDGSFSRKKVILFKNNNVNQMK